MRDRLSRSILSEPLTLSENFEIYECENFLLEGAVTSPARAYWAAHTAHFWFQIDGQNPYTAGDYFDLIRDEVCNGLETAGFGTQASELRALEPETSFNEMVFRQYSAETTLYYDVNHLLRQGNAGTSVAHHPLVPWISHLNAVLRNEPEWLSPSYRGCELTEMEVREYSVGRSFVWSSLTSVSTTSDACLGGNVLFKITPRSPMSGYGKRAPRQISKYSEFPEENEALLPLGCAFRVTKREDRPEGWLIELDLFDHN